MGRWRGGRRRWGWLLVTIDVVSAGHCDGVDGHRRCKCKEEKNEKTYLLSRLHIDMQRLAMVAATVTVNAGGWWPARSGRRQCGWSCIATGDVDEKVLQRERAVLSCKGRVSVATDRLLQYLPVGCTALQLERAGLCCNRGRVCCNQHLGRRCNGWSWKRCNKWPAGRCCN